ncbi:hypothetical protein MLD38_035690 [Melastoma candidum]|uniref:Uncharacterized protein n=1 Tax=Melastoma candidum TaxID=119954 RepID=A0ACB9LIK7_9MYRT|nr:hypothetical protein MLD38_035690 [Melastoma candidum]
MLLSLLSRRSLEVDSRDSYGFSLRPQHFQRYREYTTIYKEEEQERSKKWKEFLEQHVKQDQEKSSENINEENSLVKDTNDENLCVEIKDQIQRSTSIRTDETGDKDITEAKLNVGDINEQNVSFETSEQPQQNIVEEEAGRGDNHIERTGLDGSAQSNIESEAQASSKSESKTREVKKWVNIQPILGAVDEMMSARIPKSKDIITNLETANNIHPQTVAKVEISEAMSNHNGQGMFGKEEASDKKGTYSHDGEGTSHSDDGEELANEEEASHKEQMSNSNRTGLFTVEEAPRKENMPDDGEDVVAMGEASDKNSESSMQGEAESKAIPAEHLFPWREELESLVRGGIPKDLRGDVWQAFVGVRTRRKEKYYENLLAEDIVDTDSGAPDGKSDAPRKWKKQIEKDIPRTFPGHPALDENGRNSLRRLLFAYARHNPSVGYCQAMNFFAGLLLLLMPEENAFWTLVGIIDDYFDGYYTEEMIESQVDQLVFEELTRERFPKLVNHLDFLGVQVTWISGPWFLSIFINMLPWESVLRIWDVLLFEGNRVMLFRTALALMEFYGPALVTTKDAADAITLLQSLAGSTFDSSQLVLTACMGFLPVTETRLKELRNKHRPAVLQVIEERSKKGRIWKDPKGLASKLYSFKHDSPSLPKGTGGKPAGSDGSKLENPSDLENFLGGLAVDTEVDSLPDLQEQVVWLKVELCRCLEEKRSAILRAEELETALMEMVKQDNRRLLSAKVERLEEEIAELRQTLEDKNEQEKAMLQVLMRVEQDQRITEEVRLNTEREAAAQRRAVNILEEKYEKAQASLAQMEKRAVMAESLLEATLQYEQGQTKALSSPRYATNQTSAQETPVRRTGFFGFSWRNKALNADEFGSGKSTSGASDASSPLKPIGDPP